MKKKLIISTITVILLINIIITAININTVKKNYIDEKNNELITLVNTLSIALENNYQDISQYVENLSKNSIRVTIVDRVGNVVYETDKAVETMQNHLKRVEIQDALLGKIGTDIRFSNSIRQNFMYVAKAIEKNENYIIRLSMPLDAIDIATVNIISRLVVVIGIGAIIAILLILKIVSYFTKPVERLAKATLEIANDKIPEKLYYSSNDEIGKLYNNFNIMTNKLNSSISELENTNLFLSSILSNIAIGVIALSHKKEIIFINDYCRNILNINDKVEENTGVINIIRNFEINKFIDNHFESKIDEYQTITYNDKYIKMYINVLPYNELIGQKYGAVMLIEDITEATRLEQLRKSFVANVTHELKTPLTSIKGFVETIKNNNITDKAKLDRFMDIIDIEANRLKALIDDILLLSEIESVEGNNTRFIINEVIAEVKDLMQEQTKENNISIEFICDKQIEITLDKNRLKQLLINLVDNAIKYNKPNGSVIVSVIENNHNYEICVKDTGIGIEKSHLPRIFERFYRVDKSRSRQMGGTGLGLAIVKHIAISFNADIQIDSTLDVGTKITVVIPK